MEIKKNEKEVKPKKVKVAKGGKKVNYKLSTDGSKKNLVIVGGAVTAVIAVSVAIFFAFSSIFSTETYYLLNTNVKSSQQITDKMVVEVQPAKGTAPPNALSMEEIQRGNVYSKYPLYAGDVVSRSNAGPQSDITSGIPDDWSITSFTINSTDAVGGILGKGDYADVLGVDENGKDSKYVFTNLMILEVKFLNEEYDGTDLEGKTVVGETIHYTVGLPAKDVALLQSALNHYPIVKLVKAPYQVNYEDRDLSGTNGTFNFDNGSKTIDLKEGTDPTFTEVERDADGRPSVSKDETESSTDAESEETTENTNE